MSELTDRIERVLFSAEQISERIAQMGEQITRDYEGKELLVVSVLKGSVIFMSDLFRHIDLPCKLNFIGASSYSGTTTTEHVTIDIPLQQSVEGLNVLLVEDILDTGFTLEALKAKMEEEHAASVRICTLLDKGERRKVKTFEPDYVGFPVENEFVVGFGLDYNELYRNLPYIGVLKKEYITQGGNK